MNDMTKVPERRLRHEATSGACKDSGSYAAYPETREPSSHNSASIIRRVCPWPFKADDTSPLAWWRTLPSDAFGDPERFFLPATLEQIDVLHGGDDGAAAMKGDPAAAIGFAFSLMPIEEMTLKVDVAMTALLRCSLERNAAAALVLAQVLGLTDFGHSYPTELAASWLAYGRRCSDNPRKFSDAEILLMAAFREHHRDGDDT
jgi:hypothetical protein